MSTNTNTPDVSPEAAVTTGRIAEIEQLAARLADRVQDENDLDWRPLFYGIGDVEARLGPEVAEALRTGDLEGLPSEIADAIHEHFAVEHQAAPMRIPGILMTNCLPPLEDDQIVLASIHIASTIGEQVEFRCWYQDGAYQYDFVDEHGHSARKLYHPGLPTGPVDEDDFDEDGDYARECHEGPGICRLPIVSSKEPLTVGQMIRIMEACADIEMHWEQVWNIPTGPEAYGLDLDGEPSVTDFLSVHSVWYPGFNRWFDEKARDYDHQVRFESAELDGCVSIPEGLKYAPCFGEITDLTIEGPIDHDLVGLSTDCLGELESLSLWEGAELPDYNLPPLEDLKWTMPDGRSLWWWDAWDEVEEEERDRIRETLEERCGREYSSGGDSPLGLRNLEVDSGARVPLLPYPALTDLRLGSGVEIPATIELPSLETLHLDGTVSLPAWVDIPTLRTLRLSDEARVTGEISLPGLESLEMGRGATLSERITLPPLKSVQVGVGVKPPAGLGLPTSESFSYTAERRPVDGVEQLVVIRLKVVDQATFPSALDLSRLEVLEVGRGVELPDSLVLPSLQSLWLDNDVTLPAGLSLPALRKLRLGDGCVVPDGVLMPKLEVLHQSGVVQIGDAVETPALKRGLLCDLSGTTACRLLKAPGVQVRGTEFNGRSEWSRD